MMSLTPVGCPNASGWPWLAQAWSAWVLLFLLCSPLAASSQSCSAPAPLQQAFRNQLGADAYLKLGAWFVRNHKPTCAIQTLQAGVRLYPGSAQLSLLLGSTLYDAGRLGDAREPLQQAVRLLPGSAQAHMLLASTLDRLGSPSEALAEWKSALAIDPASPKALDGWARELIAAGDYDTVIARLGSAPPSERLMLDLGTAYQKEDRIDEAARVFNQGLKSYPNSDLLTGSLASLYVHDTQYEAASKVAAALAQRKPGDVEAQRIYLHALAVAGNNDAAAPVGRKLLQMAPHDADILQMNGYLEFKAGNYPTARKHLEEAIALDPNDPNAHANLGFVLVQMNDPAGARTQLQKALALGASDLQIHFELARALRSLGENAQAQQQLALYQKQLKENSDKYEALLSVAEAGRALRAGDKQKAADLFRKASALQPSDPSLPYRLAQILGEMGDVAGERAALEQAIQSNPNFVQAQYQLGYLDFQAGDDPGAEKQFRITLEALPNNVPAWCALASTLARQSRFPEAQQAVATALRLDPNNAVALKLRGMIAAAMKRH